jgi:hypothetical protein
MRRGKMDHVEGRSEVRRCWYDETDEGMMRRYPELRGTDGKLVPTFKMGFG